MSDRMRRVDEAVREVLSDAITKQVKDPRVGFVTVTRSGDRARPPTRPRVRVGARRARGPTPLAWRACSRRTASCSASSAASCGSSTRRRSSSSTTTPRDRAERVSQLIERSGGEGEARQGSGSSVTTRNGVKSSRELVLDELRDGERFVLTTHEHPDGDALGSLVAMQQVLCTLGKRRRLLPVGRRVPAALRVPLPRARRSWSPRSPTTSTERTIDLPRLRQHRPQPGGRAAAPRRPDPQHRPSPRQHALRHGRPRRAGGVVHRRARVGPHARARGGADPVDRRGALRRARDRHRPVHVREHRLARARHGRGADRGRNRRPRDLPAPLRGRPAGQARPAGARPDLGRALRRRAAHDHAPHARGLRRHRRGRELLRGRDRPPARRRGHGAGGAGARPAVRRRRRAGARCRCAPPTTASTCRGSRAPWAAAGTGRAAGFSTDLEFGELVSFLRAQLAQQLRAPTGSCSPTSRRG